VLHAVDAEIDDDRSQNAFGLLATPSACVGLLRKLRAALKPGGRAATLDE
jgi:hypothetical protein